METQCVNSDIISNLPRNITEYILTFMPIRDALRTSILSTKWRYTWRSMPKLVFSQDMVEVPSLGNSTHLERASAQLKKYKLVSAIFHVLLLHNGPARLEFFCDIRPLHMDSEFDQIISYIARWNTVKELAFVTCNSSYKLPASFFSLQRLETIDLADCTFEPPLTFNGFRRLKEMKFWDVKVSAQMLHRFLSKCPLLEQICLIGDKQRVHLPAGGSEFTFVDLLKCVPLIKALVVKKNYVKYLCAGNMPNVLPISLDHLEFLYLDVCLMEQNEIFFALCMIRSSPVLDNLAIQMYDSENLHVQQTPTNFLDLKDHSDLKLNYLQNLRILKFSNLPLETEFVKLIMAKSPVLEKVCINLKNDVSVDEELKILRELILLPRASPLATLTVKRYVDDANDFFWL